MKKKWIFYVMALALAGGFVACNDDDDKDKKHETEQTDTDDGKTDDPSDGKTEGESGDDGKNDKEGFDNGYEYVDMGLSVKWATTNIGAEKPEDIGNYFAWGETEEKEDDSDYSIYGYVHWRNNTWWKYNINDKQTTLEADEDAATVNRGGKWRMPTGKEISELVEKCEWAWTDDYNGTGKSGYEVTAPNGNSIFLPASDGMRYYATVAIDKNRNYYWASTIYGDGSDWGDGECLRFLKGGEYTVSGSTRVCGFQVRAVHDENMEEYNTPREAVDLGLPSGLKWANKNIDAKRPEDCGGYFAWGETATKEEASFSDWKWYKYSDPRPFNYLTKYNTETSRGTVDNKTTLDPEDDAAAVRWSGKWRMPTRAEMIELFANTTSEWTTLNGMEGRKFTSIKNGNSIFLPAAGIRTPTYYTSYTSCGYYWTSSLYEEEPVYAYTLMLYEEWPPDFEAGNTLHTRREGMPVRAVCE